VERNPSTNPSREEVEGSAALPRSDDVLPRPDDTDTGRGKGWLSRFREQPPEDHLAAGMLTAFVIVGLVYVVGALALPRAASRSSVASARVTKLKPTPPVHPTGRSNPSGSRGAIPILPTTPFAEPFNSTSPPTRTLSRRSFVAGLSSLVTHVPSPPFTTTLPPGTTTTLPPDTTTTTTLPPGTTTTLPPDTTTTTTLPPDTTTTVPPITPPPT